MKILFAFSILVFSCSTLYCQDTPANISEQAISDNEELKALYKADQADRQGSIDWAEVAERDSLRRLRVYQLLDSGKVITSNDYANAAMIFQHGGDTISSGMAVKLMRKAVELDSTRSKWLLAAAIDRDLMRRGEPQVYGTQYRKMGADAPWELYQIDTSQITDEERREYGVRTLAEQRERVIMMNKKKLSALLEEGKSIDDIIEFSKSEDPENSEYDLSETSINTFGYQLMDQDKDEEALKIFELNIALYPAAYNTYDSYGECLVKLGRIKKGKAAYKKSLELNPDNENAKRVLADLE